MNNVYTTVAAQGERVKHTGDLVKELTVACAKLKAIPQPEVLQIHDDMLKGALVLAGIPHELSADKSHLEINNVRLTRVGDYWLSDNHPVLVKGRRFTADFVAYPHGSDLELADAQAREVADGTHRGNC